MIQNQLGIAHIESNLPVADEKVTDELKKQIEQLDTRLSDVESKLLQVQIETDPPKLSIARI